MLNIQGNIQAGIIPNEFYDFLLLTPKGNQCLTAGRKCEYATSEEFASRLISQSLDPGRPRIDTRKQVIGIQQYSSTPARLGKLTHVGTADARQTARDNLIRIVKGNYTFQDVPVPTAIYQLWIRKATDALPSKPSERVRIHWQGDLFGTLREQPDGAEVNLLVIGRDGFCVVAEEIVKFWQAWPDLRFSLIICYNMRKNDAGLTIPP